jgi:hypothetical protein
MSLAVHQNYAADGGSPDGTSANPVNVAAVPLPTGATSLADSSGIVTQPADAVATLASAPGRVVYLTSVAISGLVTNAAMAALTITGLAAGTITFGFPLSGGDVSSIPMGAPMPAAAAGADIVVTLAAFGDSTDAASVMATGVMI